jgi:hypothetical protein
MIGKSSGFWRCFVWADGIISGRKEEPRQRKDSTDRISREENAILPIVLAHPYLAHIPVIP